MAKGTLQFPDLHLLWSFAKTLKIQEFQISTQKMHLTCRCDEKYIEEAITFFKAKVVKEKVVNT